MNILKDTIIEKLNSNNYDIWKFKLEMYLMKEDLFDVVNNNPPDQPNDEFIKKDKKARAIINLLIEDNQIIHVKNLDTARASWLALKNVHERSTLSSKLFLLRKLYSIKLSEGGSMPDHIHKIYQFRDKLIAIGEIINDQHLSALLLCSLPNSYDTLITALEARDEAELTPDFIRSKLIDEYSRRSEGVEYTTKNSALNVNFQKTKINKFCRYCKKNSHNIEECWNLKNKKKEKPKPSYNHNYKNQKYKSAVCFHDNKFENEYHTKGDCREKTRESNSTFLTGNSLKDNWLIDSGASTHICNNKNRFNNFKYNDSKVTIANGQELYSEGSGDVEIHPTIHENSNNTITLKNVLYVPEIKSNLISIKRATENGFVATFENDTCKITHTGITHLEGKLENNLYISKIKDVTKHDINLLNTCENKNCLHKWHQRLGHRNINQIKELINRDMALGIKLEKCDHNDDCEICIMSKLSNSPYPKTASHRASKPIELVHTDLCGPMQTTTVGGKKYFLTLIDDFSRYTVIYLLNNKHEVCSKIKEYEAMTTNKFGRKLQAIRSDNGGEYTNKELKHFLKIKGIKHQFTVPYSAPQNGVSERKNRTLIEMARCLLKQSDLPNSFWGEAICTATYIQNRLPTSSCDKTPYQHWTGRLPNLSNIKTFGCRAYAYVQKVNRRKLDDTAIEGIFVGYDNRSKGYRICTDGKNIIISRTVKFLEDKQQKIIEVNESNKINENANHQNQPLKLQLIDTEIDNTNETGNQNANINNATNTQNTLRRSERSNRGVPPDRFAFITNTNITEPKSWNELQNIKNPIEKEQWLNATKEEINSLHQNNTWELVEAPPGTKVIGCKWAFKCKYNNVGKIERYKARLVAKGFSQKFGIDYDETFAPVASHTTIRSFLAMSLYKNLTLRHLDIKTAFLHGELEEEVFMQQPEGYEIPGEEQKVCHLKKAIYGLKQAARAWNIKLHETLSKLGFHQTSVDKCLYKKTKNNITTYILVYVDDILIAGEDQNINEVIKQLKREYTITDLGQPNNYLGININRPEKDKITLDQNNKIQELVKKFGLEESKPTDTPLEPGYVKIIDDDNVLPDNIKYRQAIGALLYISTVTRPDISAAVNILSRRNENPREKDWIAVKRVIKYLKSTLNHKLTFTNDKPPVLTVYADSDWANNPLDRKSTSGNLFLLGKNPILWISKRQNCIAMSSAESEYISAASAAKEVKWLLNLLSELDMRQQCPIILYEDNQSCIKLAESDKHHQRTKHIDIRYHLIKNLVEEKLISLQYISTAKMAADPLTKALPRCEFQVHRKTLLNN